MDDRLVVETTEGAVRGVADDGNGRCFRGIPFAMPPVGDLRFQPPQPAPGWSDIRSAEHYSPAPAQGSGGLAGDGGSTFPTFPTAAITTTSEDCLYLNVWTPAASSEPLPVVVWIFGGGLEAGSANPPYSDGSALSRLTGAVVVTINYRLAALGHLFLEGWSSNLALQDQVCALGWVKRNIERFGGDPDNIIVAGQSAGAFSIGTLLGMPSARGLFAKAILHSGNASRVIDRPVAAAMAADLLDALRVDEPEQLRTVPLRSILELQGTVVSGDIGERNLPGGRAWGTVVDGTVVPVHPLHAITGDVPLLVGATRDEVRIFRLLAGDAFAIPMPRVHDEMRRIGVTDPAALADAYIARIGSGDPADVRVAFLSDAVYRRPAIDLVRAQLAAGGTAHHFLLEDEPCGSRMGAFHGSDLLFIFDKLAQVDAATPAHLAVRTTLVDAWKAFLWKGDPGWTPWQPGAPSSRAIGGTNDMVIEPPADEVRRCWPERG
ncbi:carboxylesterase/lipase family protein [Nocardia sp. NPDC058058]|uniref:carboxylesterase/lipase family protein n=1 Tax=Nocardia sp. NPDC058058 TaxID=3346317 RepID=UPI0036D8A9BB